MGIDDLGRSIAEELDAPASETVQAMATAILERHPASLRAILFYGSCLRRGSDEGVLDLYVLVDRYRDFYPSRLLAIGNALLPPNVFYLETELRGRTVRAKYAVISLAAFVRYNSPAVLQPYFWARFAQPCLLVHTADPAARQTVCEALSTAVRTLLASGLPILPPRFRLADLWTRVLTETYASEIRADRAGAPALLYEAAEARFQRVGRAALTGLPGVLSVEGEPGDAWVETRIAAVRRRRARQAWRFRHLQGKLLSLLRLAKGVVTFEGGVDYTLWKIERHTGMRVDPSWRNRPHPLLALGGELWRLYRRGAFR